MKLMFIIINNKLLALSIIEFILYKIVLLLYTDIVRARAGANASCLCGKDL